MRTSRSRSRGPSTPNEAVPKRADSPFPLWSYQKYSNEPVEQAESSAPHWSDEEYSDWDETASDRDEYENNRETFEKLKVDPKFSEFFNFTFPDMKVGRKIAEGGQGEIFEGEFMLMQKKFPCVLKVFKGLGTLMHIQRQFPDGMLEGGNSVFPGFSSGTSSILGGLVLEDGRFAGRFAIVLRKEWGDLRKLIDIRMRKSEGQGRPFGDVCAKRMMLEIAIGVRQLHNHGILHRDVKSANVLVCTSTPPSLLDEDIEDDAFHVKVFDFESSVGVVGTFFWRAPEIFQALIQGIHSSLPLSNKPDVYAYAMTCYEILTGDIPFEHFTMKDWGHVINGGRPELPDDVDTWLRDLIQLCWHQDPSQRPEFEDIVEVFKSKFPDPTTHLVEEEVEASKSHWSEIGNSHQDGLQGETNYQIFETLKQHPEFSKFFSYTFRNLKLGRKIAEGAQAKIFEAEFEKENGVKVPCVVKLFKHISLRDMVKQWPPGMLRSGDSSNHLRFGFMGLYSGATRTCEVLGANVDEDDNFAFIFNREGGDLRTLIEHRMKQSSNQSRPFKPEFAKKVMYEIALGMQHLHDHDILHRDLKASNVLVTNVFGEFPKDINEELIDIKVADFECSMLINGTRFWRAPEILKQLKSRAELTYTRKADVYSYGMTCYEVLTGGVPLEDLKRSDYAAVYERGERPILPQDISGDDPDDWLRSLIERCWHSEPSERPEFKEITEEFEKNFPFLN